MSFLFAKLLSLFTGGTAKAVTGPLKDGTGMVKDITGIRKDRVDTEIAEMNLADKRSLITKASLDDVREYDPKYKRIRARTHDHGLPIEPPRPHGGSYLRSDLRLYALGGVLVVLAIFMLVRYILRWF